MNTKMSMYFPAPNTGVLCVWCEDMYRHCLLGGRGRFCWHVSTMGGGEKRGMVYVLCVFFWGGRWIGRDDISRIQSIRDNCLHTNRQNKGWTSADRSTKATLMLTVPRSLFKSSTKDLTWPTLENIIAVWCWHKCYCYTQTLVKVSIIAY